MQTENRLIDDLAKVAASTVGVLAGVREEVEARLRQQFERVLDGMELVNRDEFEAVRAMAAEARAENERLARRIAALEKAAAGAAKPQGKKEKARKAPKKASRGA
ncbi:MAG: accessory factor UbiK family protein [Alphaproteobacteria bacterium]